MEFLCGGVKQDTLTALHTAPVHLPSLFPDSLLIKAEDKFLVVRRNVLLAVHTGSPVVSTHTLPQVADHNYWTEVHCTFLEAN